MEKIYRKDIKPDTDQIVEVYNSSGINRPTTDKERIGKMYANSNLVWTAWDKNKLVGISRIKIYNEINNIIRTQR